VDKTSVLRSPSLPEYLDRKERFSFEKNLPAALDILSPSYLFTKELEITQSWFGLITKTLSVSVGLEVYPFVGPSGFSFFHVPLRLDARML
jgi:hypothetical protein